MTKKSTQSPVPTPQAAPVLPPHVAAGELITSAWGNQVVTELQQHEDLLTRIPQANSAAVTTDAGGGFNIFFAPGFTGDVAVTVTVRNATTGQILLAGIQGTSGTAVSGYIRNHAGVAVASAALTVDYVAVQK